MTGPSAQGCRTGERVCRSDALKGWPGRPPEEEPARRKALRVEELARRLGRTLRSGCSTAANQPAWLVALRTCA